MRKTEEKVRQKALILKPAKGKSYADVLGAIRKNILPEESGSEIRGIRKTKFYLLLFSFYFHKLLVMSFIKNSV